MAQTVIDAQTSVEEADQKQWQLSDVKEEGHRLYFNIIVQQQVRQKKCSRYKVEEEGRERVEVAEHGGGLEYWNTRVLGKRGVAKKSFHTPNIPILQYSNIPLFQSYFSFFCTEIRFLPLVRLLERTLRPFFVLLRVRYPCLRSRRRHLSFPSIVRWGPALPFVRLRRG